MRILCLSDTHGMHHQINVPQDCDLLLFSGDMSNLGKPQEIHAFARWLHELPYKKEQIVCIAGNHDWLFEKEPGYAMMILEDVCHYLQDEYLYLGDHLIYGSPWQPAFCSWAFNLERGGEDLRRRWAMIPDDTTILLTHGPPHGILDQTPPHVVQGEVREGESVGCKLLRDRISSLESLKLHVFGHIHSSPGSTNVDSLLCVNASVLSEDMETFRSPIVVEI